MFQPIECRREMIAVKTLENKMLYYFTSEKNGNNIAINADDDEDIWYATENSLSLNYVLRDITGVFYEDYDQITQAFAVSVAVAAGNILHLLLGDPQPKLVMGIDTKGNYWRLTKNIEGYKNWEDCIAVENNQLFVYQFPFQTQNNRLQILKLTEILIASLFLSEVDMHAGNYGLTLINNQLVAVRIDPECSFSKAYYTDTVDVIIQKLNNYLKGSYYDHNLWENLAGNAGDFKNDLLDILHSEEAHQEKMTFLAKLVAMDLTLITTILWEQVVATTPELRKLKAELINATINRFNHFKAAFEQIKNKPFEPFLLLDYDGNFWTDESSSEEVEEIETEDSEEFDESESDEYEKFEEAEDEDDNNHRNKRKLIDLSPNLPQKRYKENTHHLFFQNNIINNEEHQSNLQLLTYEENQMLSANSI